MQSPEKPNDEADSRAISADVKPANPFERVSAWGRIVPDAPMEISRSTKAALEGAAKPMAVTPRATMSPRPAPQLLSVPTPSPVAPAASQQRPPGLLTAPTPRAPQGGDIFSGSAVPGAVPRPAPRPAPVSTPQGLAPRPVVSPSTTPAPVRVASSPAAEPIQAPIQPVEAPEPAFAASEFSLARPTRPRRRSPWPAVAAGAGVAAVIGAAVWFASRNLEEPAAPVVAATASPQPATPPPIEAAQAPVSEAPLPAATAEPAPPPVRARRSTADPRRTARTEPLLRPTTPEPAAEPAAAPVIAVPPPTLEVEPPPAAPPSPPPVPIVREPPPSLDAPMATQRPEPN